MDVKGGEERGRTRFGPDRPERNGRGFWPQRPPQPPNSLAGQFVSQTACDNMLVLAA